VAILERLGAEVVEVSCPSFDYALAAYYLILPSEASSNLAKFDGIRYGLRVGDDGTRSVEEVMSLTREAGFGPEVKRRIMLGTYALSSGYYDAYYLKALKVRTLIQRDFEKAFAQVDVIVSPTAPTPAIRIGEKVNDPLSMYLMDIYTVSANLAGIPGVSIPCGFSKSALPIGLQLMGAHFAEDRLLRIAHEYQTRTDWHKRLPPIANGGG
jgi:aspartyl-tRNA(Asn)/glutamyl-tRNA(Gln) amidotransferase subunit A